MTQPNHPLHPAIYARVSTTDQDCQVQLTELREWLKRMQWPKATEYVDHGFSGAKKSRPAFDKLMAAALDKKHDCVIVWKLDRFGRSVLHLCESLNSLQSVDVRFISASQGLDTDGSNPASRLLLMILAAIAQFERELILERSVEGRNRKLANGTPDSWVPSYGWGVTDGKPHPIAHEAEALNRIMQWRAERKSVYQIMKLLATAGPGGKPVAPKRGKAWRPNALVKIFANRTAVGEYRRCGNVYAMPFQLVESSLFADAQHAGETIRPQTQGQPSVKYLLRGYARHCAKRMLCVNLQPAAQKAADYRYYRCQGALSRNGSNKCGFEQVRAGKLETAVWRAVWARLKDPQFFYQLACALAADEAAKAPQSERDPAKELAETQAEERRVLLMGRKGMLPMDEAEREQKELRRKMAMLELEVRELRKVVEIAPLSVVERACRQFAEGPEPEGYEDRREVLDGLLDFHVDVVSKDEAVITGKLPLPEVIENAEPSQKNCSHKLTRVNSSFEPIPFEIKVKIAA